MRARKGTGPVTAGAVDEARKASFEPTLRSTPPNDQPQGELVADPKKDGIPDELQVQNRKTWLKAAPATETPEPKFSGNIRSIDGLDDDELYAALKGGWHPELPAIKDENGVVIVGHRRLRIAEEHGIEPVIKVVTFGTGADADAERIRLANISNIGAAPMTREDRKRQAERLYKDGLTQEAIAHMLGVSRQTITNDLSDLPSIGKSAPRPKTASNPKGAGRKKGSKSSRAAGPIMAKAQAKPPVERQEQDAVEPPQPSAMMADALGLIAAVVLAAEADPDLDVNGFGEKLVMQGSVLAELMQRRARNGEA